MPFLEALRLALESIWHSKLRSFFTLLGIIVSVAFLVLVVAIIQGMNAYVKENLTGAMIGTNAFQVRRTPINIGLMDDDQVRALAKRPRITVQDAEAVEQAVPDAQAVSLQSGWPAPVSDVRTINSRPACRWPTRTSANAVMWSCWATTSPTGSLAMPSSPPAEKCGYPAASSR